MTRTKTETHTIQLWPGGQSVTYRGDPDGPENQRSIRNERTENANGPRAGHWRKGTPDEWRRIRIETRAKMYGDRDILCCDSALVDDLIKTAGESRGDLAEGFGIDEIRNLYPDPSDWDTDRCREWAREHSSDPFPEQPADSDDSYDDYLEECREFVRDHIEAAEVYEWWRVSSWLCGQLHDIGEVTIDNGYGHWWGRTCTGQAWIMDGTLQQIAASFEQKIEQVARAERLVVKP